MARPKLIASIAWRYFWPKGRGARASGVALAVLGVMIGVLAMVSVLGVMNGLQQGYIRTILEVESGHLQIYSHRLLDNQQDEAILELFARHRVRNFSARMKETTMMRSFISGYQAVQLVGVSEATWSEDTGLRAQLNIKSGYFPPAGFVLLGSELATKLRVDVGSLVTILVLAEGSLEPYALTLEVSGLFSSGYYTFDANLAILNLDYMRELLGSDRSIFYTIKLEDMREIKKLESHLTGLGYEAQSWQEYNRAFFGALQLEKSLMSLMLQLIFIVTAINIYQGRRRMILQKERESMILRTLGLSGRELRIIFLLQGFFIGLFGTSLGILFGIALAWNLDTVIQWLSLAINQILNLFGMHVYLLFDNSLFYLQKIPVEIFWSDILFISTSAIGITSFAGWIAGRAPFARRPLEL